MPCYSAPYADSRLLQEVIACLPGGEDRLEPLFAAVPWSFLADPVLAAVNEHCQDSSQLPWESFPPCQCGPATVHPLLTLMEEAQGSRIAAFGSCTMGRSHDAHPPATSAATLMLVQDLRDSAACPKLGLDCAPCSWMAGRLRP